TREVGLCLFAACATRLSLFVLLRTVSPCRSSVSGIPDPRWCRVYPVQMRRLQGPRQHRRLLRASKTSYFFPPNFDLDFDFDFQAGGYSSTEGIIMQCSLDCRPNGDLLSVPSKGSSAEGRCTSVETASILRHGC